MGSSWTWCPWLIPGAAWLNLVLTLLWFLTVTNAMQFLDGMDGLAAGLGVIAGLFFSIAALQMHQSYIFILAAPLVGACLGFLPYNLRPGGALIFLGDSGASFIGFTLAGLAVMGEWAENNPIVALLTPVLILAVPLFDIAFVGVVRVVTGKVHSLREWLAYAAKDHIHHRFEAVGLTKTQSVFLIYFIAATLGLSAILLKEATPREAGAGVAASRLRAGDHRRPRGRRSRASPLMISLRRMCSPHQWRQWLAMLVSLDESPWRMALALAVGVFISFTPFWGFQTLLALVVATVGRLNPRAHHRRDVAQPAVVRARSSTPARSGSDRRCCRDLSGLAGWSVWLLVGTTTLGLVAGARDVARRLQRAPRAARAPRADRMRRIAPPRLSRDRPCWPS